MKKTLLSHRYVSAATHPRCQRGPILFAPLLGAGRRPLVPSVSSAWAWGSSLFLPVRTVHPSIQLQLPHSSGLGRRIWASTGRRSLMRYDACPSRIKAYKKKSPQTAHRDTSVSLASLCCLISCLDSLPPPPRQPVHECCNRAFRHQLLIHATYLTLISLLRLSTR